MIAGWTLSLLTLGFALVWLIKYFNVGQSQLELIGGFVTGAMSLVYFLIGLYLLLRKEIGFIQFVKMPLFYSLIGMGITCAMLGCWFS